LTCTSRSCFFSTSSRGLFNIVRHDKKPPSEPQNVFRTFAPFDVGWRSNVPAAMLSDLDEVASQGSFASEAERLELKLFSSFSYNSLRKQKLATCSPTLMPSELVSQL